MMSCCCEEGPCAIFYDTSYTSLASYTQVEGTWSISGTSLTTSDADALIVKNTVHPDGNGSGWALFARSVKVSSHSVLRLIVGYLDADNYGFLELNHDASAKCYSLKVGKRVSGTDTIIVTRFMEPLVDATAYNIGINWNGTQAQFGLSQASAVAAENNSFWSEYVETGFSLPGDKVGFATGSSITSLLIGSLEGERFSGSDGASGTGECNPATDACLRMNDGFLRSDSSDLGCAWEEVSGAWEIASNKLSCVSSGLVIHNRTLPVGAHWAYLQMSTTAIGSGGYVRLIVAYTDADNYLFAEVRPSTPSQGRVRLWKRSAGVETQIAPGDVFLTSSTSDSIGLTYNGTLLSVARGSPPWFGLNTTTWMQQAAYIPGFTGTRAGIGASAGVLLGQATTTSSGVYLGCFRGGTFTQSFCQPRATGLCTHYSSYGLTGIAPGRIQVEIPETICFYYTGSGTPAGNCFTVAAQTLILGASTSATYVTDDYRLSNICQWEAQLAGTGGAGGRTCGDNQFKVVVGLSAYSSGDKYLWCTIGPGVVGNHSTFDGRKGWGEIVSVPVDSFAWNGVVLDSRYMSSGAYDGTEGKGWVCDGSILSPPTSFTGQVTIWALPN